MQPLWSRSAYNALAEVAQVSGFGAYHVSTPLTNVLVEGGDRFRACDPATTMIAVASKTFTTIETMTNADSALTWLRENGVTTAAQPLPGDEGALTSVFDSGTWWTAHEADRTLEQLNELIGIDPQLLTRPDQYGATPLHHYLRNCVVPSSEFVRLLHEKMVDVPAVGAAATEVKQDGSKLDVGIACRNAWGMTPVMDLMENPNLFRSSTTTDESVLRLFETIDELDDEAFVRAEPYNGFSACHYLFSTAKLSPSLVETLLKCDPTALERATTGTGEPKTPVRLLLSNSNETMDVFLRLAPVFPGILEDVVSIMYSGVLDRPGSPGQMLEPLVKSTVEKHAAEVLVRKVISLQLFSHEDAAHVLSHSNDSDLDDSDDDMEGGDVDMMEELERQIRELALGEMRGADSPTPTSRNSSPMRMRPVPCVI